MTRPHFVAALLCAAWFGMAGITHADRPNVLLMLADDLGYSDLGSMGSENSHPEYRRKDR